MSSLQSGFLVRVWRARGLPYPVNVFLPSEARTTAETTAPRCKGPELDIVVPTDDCRHTALGLFMDSWSLLESQLHFVISKLLIVDLASTEVVMALRMRGFIRKPSITSARIRGFRTRRPTLECTRILRTRVCAQR
jgi:hypothetical protein